MKGVFGHAGNCSHETSEENQNFPLTTAARGYQKKKKWGRGEPVKRRIPRERRRCLLRLNQRGDRNNGRGVREGPRGGIRTGGFNFAAGGRKGGSTPTKTPKKPKKLWFWGKTKIIISHLDRDPGTQKSVPENGPKEKGGIVGLLSECHRSTGLQRILIL